MALTGEFGPSVGLRTGGSVGGSDWNMDFAATCPTPPAVGSGGVEITSRSTLDNYIENRSAFGNASGGLIYKIHGDGTGPFIMNLTAETQGVTNPLYYPVWIKGFTGIWVKGAEHLNMTVSDDGDIGQVTHNGGDLNQQPALWNGGGLWAIEATANDATFWFEGCYADIKVFSNVAGQVLGQNADYFIHRGDDALNDAGDPTNPQQMFYCVNTRMEGAEGEELGIHGDIWHNQAGASAKVTPRVLTFENTVWRHGMGGIVYQRGAGQTTKMRLSRYHHTLTDEGQQSEIWKGFPVGGHHSEYPDLQECYYNRYDSSSSVFGNLKSIPGEPDKLQVGAANSPNPGSLDRIDPNVTYSTPNSSDPNFGCEYANLGYAYNSFHSVF